MLFMSVYGQSHRAAALHYISLGIGFVAGAQLMGLTTDWLYRRDSQPKPELRIKLLLPSIVVAGLGLLCLGWSAKARTHWIVPDIGLVLFSAGYQCATQCQNAYIINVYGPKGWSASANAGIWAVKSIAGLCFPLFAPALYRSHGWGWGNSILATGFVAASAPVAIALHCHGEVYRNIGEKRLGE